jgi:CDP-diacylglycerol--glycerol-3-phosphate 3-phosphatidyltransferase
MGSPPWRQDARLVEHAALTDGTGGPRSCKAGPRSSKVGLRSCKAGRAIIDRDAREGRPVAHLLTTARLLLTLPFGILMMQSDERSAWLAALVLAAAIATDALDGPVARRRGTATAAGRVFDHATDCCFVTTGLAAGAARGVFPWSLPVAVAAAFTQYVVDSYWLHGSRALRPSALGRWNGILYFAPLGGDVLVRAGLDDLRPAVSALAWALVVSTGLSMAARLWATIRRVPPAPGSPAGGRVDPPRR